ncbi:LIM/homeobox protein Lhx9-like [Watersipora subatra]|uniref:LIM/homeobox protein Lhx9-like n=1 Tax=Watersipora subatra TaxID=2589382 RepID=UPI00355BFD2C
MVECREPGVEERDTMAGSAATVYSTADLLSGTAKGANCTMPNGISVTAGGPCAECGESIVDRFYLYALERRWHNSCLSCSVCSRHLESEGSCYVKDGLIYCKEDYFRRFGAQKCARCFDTIQSGQMVMRAQSAVYHVKCFTCTACSALLQTGDHFGVYGDDIYCRTDFLQLQYHMDTSGTPPSSQFDSIISSSTQSIDTLISNNCLPASTLPPNTNFDEINFSDYPPPLTHSSFTEQAASKSQRSKKRRQDTNIPRGNEPSWQLGMNMMEPENGFHQNGPQPQHVKQKRMRTSFKHHQLKVMKQYFTINHNPDAKDLKQLSHKTGLSKRVLQVWFQNARAKFRRGQGEGGKEGTDGGDNINDDENNSNEDILSDAESHDLDSTASGRSPSADLLQTNSPLDDLKQHNSQLIEEHNSRLLETPPPSSGVTVNHSDSLASICI